MNALDAMTTVLVLLVVVLVMAVAVLFRKVRELTPDQALAAKKAARVQTAQRVRSASRQRLDNGRDRIAATAQKVEWKPVLATVLVLGLIVMNAGFMFSQRAQINSLEQQLETVLSGDVDQGDLADADAEDVSVPDEVQDQLDRLEGQVDALSEENDRREAELDALRQENDELEAELAERAEETDSSPPATQASASTGSDPESAECPEEIATWFESQGFESGDYRCGDFIESVTERGDTSFSDMPISTREELVEFLNSDSPQASSARAALRDSLSSEDYRRALRGEGFVLSQITVPAQYEANSYFRASDGAAVFYTTPRAVESGDLLWVYTSANGEVVESGNIRVDCANPRAERIVPQKEPPKEEPPKEEPPKEEPPKEEPPKEEPPKEEPPEEEEPKCFDSDGNPVFEGEFCADPDEGPEQQDPRDDEVEPTPGYERGDAEETRENQDEARDCIDAGECDPHDPTQDGVEVPDSKDGGEAPGGDVTEPDEQDNDTVPDSGNDNPDYDGSDPTENPDDGTSDPEDTPAEDDDSENEGDPLDDLDLPNVP